MQAGQCNLEICVLHFVILKCIACALKVCIVAGGGQMLTMAQRVGWVEGGGGALLYKLKCSHCKVLKTIIIWFGAFPFCTLWVCTYLFWMQGFILVLWWCYCIQNIYILCIAQYTCVLYEYLQCRFIWIPPMLFYMNTSNAVLCLNCINVI